MTFDIKKLSTAFVAALMLTAGSVVADAQELSKHDEQVVRATNVFYNLFATNALQAARVDASGNVTAGSLNVVGNSVLNGSLQVNGALQYASNLGLLNPVGSAENAGARMAWARIASGGSVTTGSGVVGGTQSSGSVSITWTNAFTVAPTVVVSGTAANIIVEVTSISTTGATIVTYTNSAGTFTAGNAAFNLIAVGV